MFVHGSTVYTETVSSMQNGGFILNGAHFPKFCHFCGIRYRGAPKIPEPIFWEDPYTKIPAEMAKFWKTGPM